VVDNSSPPDAEYYGIPLYLDAIDGKSVSTKQNFIMIKNDGSYTGHTTLVEGGHCQIINGHLGSSDIKINKSSPVNISQAITCENLQDFPGYWFPDNFEKDQKVFYHSILHEQETFINGLRNIHNIEKDGDDVYTLYTNDGHKFTLKDEGNKEDPYALLRTLNHHSLSLVSINGDPVVDRGEFMDINNEGNLSLKMKCLHVKVNPSNRFPHMYTSKATGYGYDASSCSTDEIQRDHNVMDIMRSLSKASQDSNGNYIFETYDGQSLEFKIRDSIHEVTNQIEVNSPLCFFGSNNDAIGDEIKDQMRITKEENGQISVHALCNDLVTEKFGDELKYLTNGDCKNLMPYLQDKYLDEEDALLNLLNDITFMQIYPFIQRSSTHTGASFFSDVLLGTDNGDLLYLKKCRK